MSLKTTILSLPDSTLTIFVISSKNFIFGKVSASKVKNLFLRLLELSSILPLDWLLIEILSEHFSTGQSRNKTQMTLHKSPKTSRNPSKFSLFLGNPSTMYVFFYFKDDE